MGTAGDSNPLRFIEVRPGIHTSTGRKGSAGVAKRLEFHGLSVVFRKAPQASIFRSKWTPDLHFEAQMPPRDSILGSRWRPGGPSESPRAYFGGLGGDVGAPGGLLEAPRRPLWSSRGGLGTPWERSRDLFWSMLGRLGEWFWSICCACGGS